MRLWLSGQALVVTATWGLFAAVAPAAAPPKADATCGSHGTSVEFMASPREAAAQAKEEQKLVFVLHVSGHFETPKFT
jgi:hypothetical protein